MRPVLHNDLTTAARAILAAPEAEREELVAFIIQQAEFADRYYRRIGKVHCAWGDGTLAAAARPYKLKDEPTLDNSEYCECMILVLGGLVARRSNLMVH
jgi:hypothetical protein